MKKKLFGMISILVVVTLLAVGCNRVETIGVIDPDPVVLEPVASEQPVESEEPIASELVVSEPENEGDPDLIALEVTEEFAKANKCLCLYRKGKLYSLGPFITAQSNDIYYCGQLIDSEKAMLVVYNTQEQEALVLDNVPEIKLTDGDELRDYDGTYEKFSPVDDRGWTVDMWVNGSLYVYEYVNQINPTTVQRFDKVEILDKDGNVVDRYGLKHSQPYTITWYEGVDYHEVPAYANSKIYDNPGDWVAPERELTKNGYVLLDWTSMPAGQYLPWFSSIAPFIK